MVRLVVSVGAGAAVGAVGAATGVASGTLGVCTCGAVVVCGACCADCGDDDVTHPKNPNTSSSTTTTMMPCLMPLIALNLFQISSKLIVFQLLLYP